MHLFTGVKRMSNMDRKTLFFIHPMGFAQRYADFLCLRSAWPQQSLLNPHLNIASLKKAGMSSALLAGF